MKTNNQAAPSHGRGRRFNPYNAHHFPAFSEGLLGTTRRNSALNGTAGRGQRVDGVPRPFHTYDSVPVAVHYVGFRDDRFWSAYRIWGGPRFIHRWWDKRAQREIAPNDIVIFAEGDWRQEPRAFNAPDIIETCSDSTLSQSPGVRCMAGRPTAKKADRQLFAGERHERF